MVCNCEPRPPDGLFEIDQFQELNVKFLVSDLQVFYSKYFPKEKSELRIFAV